MSKGTARIAETRKLLGQRPTTEAFLRIALGFLVIGQYGLLKGQEPAQGLNQSPAAPAGQAPIASPTAAPPYDEYLINPGDVLDVYVYDVPELSHTYTVSQSGVITVPLLPTPLRAVGLTPDQLARGLEDAFRQSGRLNRPEIAVSVKQSLSSSVAVEGAVKNPLIVPAIGRIRLVDVLTQCGGLADDVGTNVTITRGSLALRNLTAEGGQATPTLTVELKKVMGVTDPASAIEVWPGDRVSVERERPDVYYVLGEVKTPGGYTLKKGHEELTVLRALAIAGDATSVAKRSKAMIIRKDPNGPQGREEIKLDLQRILMGKSPDPKLQADDILFIPGSNGKKALKTIETAPGYIISEAGAAAIITH
jgi:polysaccharide export outer membrane protein